MDYSKNQFIWKENFPPVYGHTSISFLKRCNGFHSAKTGDMDAALTIVSACVKKNLILEINKKYPKAILLPIITNNKLPVALAMIFGLEVYCKISLSKTIDRKSLSAMERLLHLPTFSGNIKKNKTYIIVDDIVTQGGTISALRKYVISHGGFVTAIIALAYSINSKAIAPSLQDISNLMAKFNNEKLAGILKKYHIAENFNELTKSQITYLLKFNELDKINIKLENAFYTLNQKGYNAPVN